MTPRRSLTASLACLGLVVAGCGDDDDTLEADAGDDFSVTVGEAPDFDGCGSSGDIVNYEWVIIEAPSSMTDDVGKPLREVDDQCSFTLESAMVVDEVGGWVIELTVTDAGGASSTDSVQVDVVE